MTCSSGWRPVSRLAFEERRGVVLLRVRSWGRRIWVRRFIVRVVTVVVDWSEKMGMGDWVMGRFDVRRC